MDRSIRAFFFALSCAAILAACDSPPPPPDGGGDCTPGTAGCPCIDGTMCQGGLVCEMGLCQGVDSVEIEVTDVNARSCEAIVVEDGTEVLDVDFEAGTMGAHQHEAPRTAVTFSRRDDTPFVAGSVRLQRTDVMGGTLTLRRGRCFDRDGEALAGEPLRLLE